MAISTEKNIVHYIRGESAALGHFSDSIFFGKVDNEDSKNKYSSIYQQEINRPVEK